MHIMSVAGIFSKWFPLQVIQIDEAALREGLPLRKSEHAFYLDWAVHSFRITNCGVQDTTQVIYLECHEGIQKIFVTIIIHPLRDFLFPGQIHTHM